MGEGSGLNGADRRRHRWESDRVIVLLKPGNAGGGKDPDFWCACRRRRGSVNWRKPVKHRMRPGAFRTSCIVVPRRGGDMDDARIDNLPYARDETSRKAGCGKSACPV